MKVRLILRLFFIFCFCLGLGQPNMEVQAATCTWTGSNSYWDNVSNWSCGHVPTSSDDVVIPAGLTAYPVINYLDRFVAYANDLTIQGGANILVKERLELVATKVDNFGLIKTEGMDSTYIRGYATINNYGTINA